MKQFSAPTPRIRWPGLFKGVAVLGHLFLTFGMMMYAKELGLLGYEAYNLGVLYHHHCLLMHTKIIIGPLLNTTIAPWKQQSHERMCTIPHHQHMYEAKM